MAKVELNFGTDAQAPAAGSEAQPLRSTGQSRAGASYYSKADDCLRLFAYSYRPIYADSPPRVAFGNPQTRLGSFVHELLMRHYNHKKDGGVPEAAPTRLNRVELEALAKAEGMPPGEVGYAVTEMFRRFKHYVVARALHPWRPLKIEEEFAVGVLSVNPQDPNAPAVLVPEGTPGSVLFTARIDLVAEDNAGVWFNDHKTGENTTDSTAEAYGLTTQIHGHERLGRYFYGDRFQGVKLNFFPTGGEFGGKVKFEEPVRPKPAPWMVEDFPRTIWRAAQRIAFHDATAKSARDWPAKAQYSCSWCAYRSFCQKGG